MNNNNSLPTAFYWLVSFFGTALLGIVLIFGWQNMPTIATILMWFIVAFVILAGLACIALLATRIYSSIVETQIRKLEASKIHADNSAIMTKAGIVQLQPSFMGYGTSSGLKSYHFAQPAYQQQVQPYAIPQLETEPVKVQPITAQEAINLLPRNSMSWCFGVDAETGQPIIQSIIDSVHVLNVASSGQGKTSLTANLIAQLVKANDPDLYTLMIADMKRTIGKPFEPYCLLSEHTADGYIKVVEWGRKLVDQRRLQGEFDAPLVVIVLEEALAIKMMMDAGQLKIYSDHMNIIATVGREYNVFLMACFQVDYASKEFQATRGQFMTRLGGAFIPTAANSMGFMDTALVKRLWKEKQPGQFMLEGPDGSRVIRTPILDLKRGDLTRLLQPGTPSKASGFAASKGSYSGYGSYRVDDIPDEPQAARSPYNTSGAVDAVYRELKPMPQHLEKAWQAYQQGATTVRSMQAALGVSTSVAGGLLRELRTLYNLK